MKAEFQFSVELFNSMFSDGDIPAHRITNGIPAGAVLKSVRLDGDEGGLLEDSRRLIFTYEGDNLPATGYITPVAERRFNGVN